MLKFKDDSYGYSILKMIALCGEFPYQSLYLLDGNERIIKRTILNMKKEGYITINGKGVMKNIRITKKAFEPLSNIGKDYLDYYLSITDNHHFRGGKDNKADTLVWRKHRMAEILTIFVSMGVSVWAQEKKELTLNSQLNAKSIDVNEIVFYTSREMKNSDIEQRYKTEFTRIMGLLISPGGVYSIYNTNKGLMKWNKQGEGKAQVLVEDIVSINCKNKYECLDNAIMFGKDMQPALDILKSNGGKKDANDFELLSFDNTFNNIYYITIDDNGIYQLKLLIQKNWHEIIKTSIFPEKFLITDYISIDCDAYDKENNKYIMIFLDGNIGKLKRFKEATYDNFNKKFEVVCFDWQESMIKDYMGDSVSLVVITPEKLNELITNNYN